MTHVWISERKKKHKPTNPTKYKCHSKRYAVSESGVLETVKRSLKKNVFTENRYIYGEATPFASGPC